MKQYPVKSISRNLNEVHCGLIIMYSHVNTIISNYNLYYFTAPTGAINKILQCVIVIFVYFQYCFIFNRLNGKVTRKQECQMYVAYM